MFAIVICHLYNIVGAPTLRTVCQELGKVQHKAYQIGIQLGIPCEKMQEFIKHEGETLSLAIHYWLSGNVPEVPVTWKFLADTLVSAYVGEKGLAKDISTKYCDNSKGNQACTYPNTVVAGC